MSGAVEQQPSEPRQPARASIPWTPKDMLAGLVSLVVLSLVVLVSALLLREMLGIEDQSGSELLALSSGLALEAILLVIVWRLTVRKYRIPWQALGFRQLPSSNAVVAAGAVVVAGLAIVALYGAVVQWLGLDMLEPAPLPDFLSEVGVPWALGVLLVVVVAPIAEETFFRGFLFAGLTSRYGLWWGAGVSALVFAVSHVEPGSVFPAFILGLMLAWLYTRTGTLWSCILAHFLYNGIILAIATQS